MSDQPLERYWFRRKAIGYGFTPVTWEGWLATLVFVLILVATLLQLVPHAPGLAGWVDALRTPHRGDISDLLANPAVGLEAGAELAGFLVFAAWKAGPR